MAIGDYSRINFVRKVTKVSADNFNRMDAKIKELDTSLSQSSGGGNNIQHYHDTDRARANHTGTQLATTISDFASTVRSTLLSGLSTASSTVIANTDSILSAIGKLQAQISLKLDKTGDSKDNTITFTVAETLANIATTESHATLFGKIAKMFSFIETDTLNTTNKTISGAINELSTKVSATFTATPTNITSLTTALDFAYKYGNAVTYSIAGTATWTSGTSYTIETLPTGFIPSVEINQGLYVGNNASCNGVLTITTAGVVKFKPLVTISAKTVFTILYRF